jgi:hypothetical protein
MPNNVVKSYATKTKKSVATVEKYWDEAKASAEKAIGKKGPRFWAYVNGIVKKRLGLAESALTFKEFVDLEFTSASSVPQEAPVEAVPPAAPDENANFARFLGCLFAARDKAHELHLAAKSYAIHVALNELYDELLDQADKMAESYQGKHGIVDLKVPAANDIFGQDDAKSFVYALSGWLETVARGWIGDDEYVINQFEELVGEVYRAKYKIDNLQ